MNPTPVVLYGDAVRLEPLDATHADDLLAAGADPDIWRYLPIPQPRTLAEVRQWIDQAWKLASTGEELPFAVIDPESGRAVGSTRYLDIHRDWRTLEIGWTWLAASAQRTAVNTETKLLLLTHAFEDQGALRVQFKTDARNLRSQQAIERLGAVKEGVLRKYRIAHDGYVKDGVYYSIVDDEWPAVKARLAARLAR
jgi:RimJ/RimL family protein N-acetyltransferase